MKKYNIKRRSRSDAAYLQHNPNGDPFEIKTRLSPNEKLLYGLGLGIYWGEGNKTTPHTVAVANSDPKIIKVFITFLINICGLDTDKIRYSIVCFNNSNEKSVRKYWSNHLKILPSKFGKIVQIPPQGRGSYKRKKNHGVCTIWVGNIKLKKWIMGSIDNIDVNLPG
ncbi:hypothetical protein ACFL0F_01675 [Patescibacteria group bacterium]